jgi:hypothetical protein
MLAVGEAKQAVPLQRSAFRAENVANIGIAIAEKPPPVTAKRTFPGEFTQAAQRGSPEKLERSPIVSNDHLGIIPSAVLERRPGNRASKLYLKL